MSTDTPTAPRVRELPARRLLVGDVLALGGTVVSIDTFTVRGDGRFYVWTTDAGLTDSSPENGTVFVVDAR